MKGFALAFLGCLLLLPEWSDGQSFFAIRRERSLMLTAGTGSSTYYGELSNPGTLIKLQPNFNVGIQKFVSPRVIVHAEFNWFVLQGSDAQANSSARKMRGLSFRSNCYEFSTTGAINLFANGNRYYRRESINFYAFTGIGLLYFNPTGTYKGKTYSLEPLHTEGVSYSRVVPVIPVGLGARLRIGPNTNVVLEGGYRKTFTDYLDDVSNKYTAPSSNPVVAYFQNPNNPSYNPGATGSETNTFNAGSKRGDPKHTDSYFLLNVKVEYYLPSGNGEKRRNKPFKRSTYRFNKKGQIRRTN